MARLRQTPRRRQNLEHNGIKDEVKRPAGYKKEDEAPIEGARPEHTLIKDK